MGQCGWAIAAVGRMTEVIILQAMKEDVFMRKDVMVS
jgi:hypothetical protein